MTYSTPRTDDEIKTRVMLDQYMKCEENNTIVGRALACTILAKYHRAMS